MNPKTMTQERGQSLTAESDRERLLRDLPLTARTLSLAGVSTPVFEGGMGPPMVLLHGPAGNALHWLRMIPHLVPGYRIIVPDLPGHGASQVNTGSLDTAQVIQWLGELIKATCATPPVVVAHVLGGAIALRYAAAHGGRLDRLVLVDTLGLAPFQPTPEFGAALHQYLTQPARETHQALWQQCAYDLEQLKNGLGEKWAPFESYNLDRAGNPTVVGAVMKLMEEFGMAAIPPRELEGIKVPVTLVWGRHDRAIPLALAQTASGRYGWPLHVIEDAAADPPMEQPEALARVANEVPSS